MDTDIEANLKARWASSALLLYDIIITMDQEVDLVWNSDWTLAKALYFIARYLGLGSSAMTTVVSTFNYTNKVCRIFNPVQYLCILITLAAPDGLLLLRVLALYSSRPRLRILLVGLFAAVMTMQIVLIGIEFKLSVRNHDPPEALNFGCLYSSGLPDYAYSISSAAILSFNTLLFVLSLIVLIPMWPRVVSFNSIVSLMIRDGLMYFALMCATYAILTAMPFALSNRPGIELIGLPWSVAIGPIASCRLFLNLRGMRKQPSYDTTTDADDRRQPGPKHSSREPNHTTDVQTQSDEQDERDTFELTEFGE